MLAAKYQQSDILYREKKDPHLLMSMTDLSVMAAARQPPIIVFKSTQNRYKGCPEATESSHLRSDP